MSLAAAALSVLFVLEATTAATYTAWLLASLV
jgi:hypothetical protein